MTFPTKFAVPYQYIECGLSYIYLTDGFIPRSTHGKKSMGISHRNELNGAIALHLACRQERLAGPEILYLRKFQDFNIEGMARFLNVRVSEVQKWERATKPIMHPLPEALLRASAAKVLSQTIDVLLCYNMLLKEQGNPVMEPELLFMEKTENGWRVASGS